MRPRVPEGMRVYAVGDIHGELGLLEELHEKMVADAENANVSQILQIFLGDYVDRGAESKGVIDWLLSPAPVGWQRICLKGNHEKLLLDFLGGGEPEKNWRRLGGTQTLLSYGVKLKKSDGVKSEPLLQSEFSRKISKKHRNFYSKLPLFSEFGDYFFVHAGVRPDRSLPDQEERDLLWIRNEFLDSKVDFGKIVVHGHTPLTEPEIHPNRINIDTGAYMSGKLTCLVLEGEEQRFL